MIKRFAVSVLAAMAAVCLVTAPAIATLNGVTIVAGSGGEVTLNNAGISIEPGDDLINGYHFDGVNAGLFYSTSATPGLTLDGAGDLWLLATGATMRLSAGTIKWPQQGGGGNRYVCIDNNGDLFTDDDPCN